ncbi:MAG: hypothetical protein EXR62_16000 [Chloroflexi bacterium]|nr:hypothetical protein [Chloroflexota bacterium]
MEHTTLEEYLHELDRELRSQWMFQPRILEEVQSHLLEAVEQGERNGLSPAEAQRLALQRFGPAKTLAIQFTEERRLMMQKTLLAAGLALGLGIAYVDSRPTWDDAGITAMAILATCGMLGLLGAKRPWLWALVGGIWIPLFAILNSHNFTSLLVLVFAFAGAYGGWAVRKVVRPATA